MAELAPAETWASARSRFSWRVPGRYNIAHLICDRWAMAEPDRIALIHLPPDGAPRRWSYAQLFRRSNQLANALAARGLSRGDRCALLLPQSAEALLTHLACYKLGAIAVPLFTLFGEEALAYRLADSGATALITDAANLPKIDAIRERLPALRVILSTDGPARRAEGFAAALEGAKDEIERADTGPDDPAFIAYTSGTTGPPKGALHAQRVLAGHLPGVQMVHDFLPRDGDCFWTPADWAWMGGSMNVMMPALYCGVPLVAHRMTRFDPERAFALMAEYAVRNVFLPPTALRLMRDVETPARFGLRLRTLASGGEPLGTDLLEWGRAALGLTIHEFYGQTECNKVLGNNSAIAEVRPGAMGLEIPGHDVAVIDAEGREAAAGEPGEIAVRAPDPGMFLGYWGLPDKTAAKFVGDWMTTGDLGQRDADGFFYFTARDDDVITSSGYRVGPSEIEDCLAGHADVAFAAVVGVPDPVRTEAIKAFVKLREGRAPDDALRGALIAHARARLSPHLAPAVVEFVDEIPMTATGKIMRRALKEGS